MKKDLRSLAQRLRVQYAFNCATSLALGLWTVIAPETFWGSIGINGSDPIVQAIYGAGICGEGIINGLGVRSPLRYLVILQYMMAYKAVVVLGLVPRLVVMDSAPLAAWIVVACWAFAGLQSAWAYPWGRWEEVVRAMQDE